MGKLPTAIQRAADEAAAIELAMTQGPTPSQPVEVTASDPPAIQTPAPVAAPVPAPAPAEPSKDAAYWEQRFKTVAGMYQKTVPELQAQLAELQKSVAATQQQLAAKPEPKSPEQPVVDPKDVAAFGEDLVEMVQRQAKTIYSAMAAQVNDLVARFEQRVTALEQQVTGVAKKADTSIEQQFYMTLSKLVPDWEAVNESQEWLAWLAQVDPVYGAPRQAALDAAFNRFDVERVASVFDAFKASRPAPAPAPSLANQVAPSTSGTAAAPAATEQKPIYTQKTLNDFFLDVAKGRYRGREAEAARIERELETAAAEGRIR